MLNEMILLIYTSGHGFAIQKGLKKRGIACRLTPIPRTVSSDCGICVRFAAEDETAVREFLTKLPFDVEGILRPEDYSE